MNDLDLYKLLAGIDVPEQVEAQIARRHVHEGVNIFTGKLYKLFKTALIYDLAVC